MRRKKEERREAGERERERERERKKEKRKCFFNEKRERSLIIYIFSFLPQCTAI